MASAPRRSGVCSRRESRFPVRGIPATGADPLVLLRRVGGDSREMRGGLVGDRPLARAGASRLDHRADARHGVARDFPLVGPPRGVGRAPSHRLAAADPTAATPARAMGAPARTESGERRPTRRLRTRAPHRLDVAFHGATAARKVGDDHLRSVDDPPRGAARGDLETELGGITGFEGEAGRGTHGNHAGSVTEPHSAENGLPPHLSSPAPAPTKL